MTISIGSHTPDVYVMPKRPSFTGSGSDATAYAWMAWQKNRSREYGHVHVLEYRGLETSRMSFAQ